MRYFKNVTTLEELRKQYRELIKMYHPDTPQGSTEATQAINVEYDELFKWLKDKHESGTRTDKTEDNSYYNSNKYDYTEDARLRDVLQKIITFTNINIEIIGRWIWVDGNTFQYKEQLKSLGFRWDKNRKKWYFHSDSFWKKSNKKLSMDDIRNYYGSTGVKPKQPELLKQA